MCASSRGLGKACATALAREGCSVVINGLDPERLERAATEIREATGAKVMPMRADINTEEGHAALIAACSDADILVNNNAGPTPGRFDDWKRADWQAAIDANMLAPIFMIQALLPGMRARKFGRIVNVTSAMVKSPLSQMGLSTPGARHSPRWKAARAAGLDPAAGSCGRLRERTGISDAASPPDRAFLARLRHGCFRAHRPAAPFRAARSADRRREPSRRVGRDRGRGGVACAARRPCAAKMANATLAVSQSTLKKPPVDPLRDLAPVTQMARVPQMIGGHPSLPPRNVKELIAFMRARPGAVDFSAGNYGGHRHVTMALFMSMTGISGTFVPYKSGNASLVDGLSGRSTGVEGNFVTDSSSATAVSQSALNRRQVSVSHRTLAIALTPSPKGAGFVANT